MKKVLLLAAVFFAACSAPKPTNWATECADRFPSRTDTFRITTETVRFDTVIAEATKVLYSFKTVCPPSDTVRIVDRLELVDCPPTQTVVKTRVLHDSIIVYTANVAAENLLKSKLDSTKTKLDVQNRVNRSLKTEIAAQKRQIQREVWLNLFLIVVLAFSAYLLIKFKEKYDEKNS